MTVIHVRTIIDWTIDTEVYVAAGIEADWFVPGDVDPADLSDITYRVADLEEEQLIPRWARDCIKITDQLVEYDVIPRGDGERP